MMKNKEIIVVVGPTASGKSDFAVELAQKVNGEIISADSRQIYKELDIGTGKITKKEMKGVQHYMLDVSNVDDTFSVSEYKNLAEPILKDILSRGKIPIICGGTGQYIDALIFDTSIPHVAPNKKLRDTLEKKTTEELHELLLKKDSRRAKEIDPHNRVRIIRALEITESLGKVPLQEKAELRYQTKIYLLSPTRELLRERITERLLKRLKVGMIDEIKNILKKGYTSDEMKKFGLEYVTIAKYLEGKITEEEMQKEIITKSMQYAKRQETWNKKYLATYKNITIVVPVE